MNELQLFYMKKDPSIFANQKAITTYDGGAISTTEYDENGRIKATTYEGEEVSSYKYDEDANRYHQFNKKGETIYGFDENGNENYRKDPDGTEHFTTHDEHGYETSYRCSDGSYCHTELDELGREIKMEGDIFGNSTTKYVTVPFKFDGGK